MNYEESLMVKAAWYYYFENMTQQAIADRLSISRMRVIKLLETARQHDFALINLHGSPGEDGLVQAMLEKKGFDAPKFSMDESITDFYAFTKDSFRMEDYRYHPFDFEIPMAI